MKLRLTKNLNVIHQDEIHFKSDDEFTDFCVAPYAMVKESPKGTLYYGGEYSQAYLNAIKEGKYFVIEDKNSTVYKRKCVTKRVPVLVEGLPTSRLPKRAVQLNVQNLRPYYEEFID